MIKPTRLIDGGYLSWVYGASSWGLQQWGNGAYQKYARKTGSLMLMDSKENVRKAFDDTYKGHRAERLSQSQDRVDAKERVDLLRAEIFAEDPRVHTFEVEGLEADDLIAIFVHLRLIKNPVPVVGVDKDLLQLPVTHLALEDHRGKAVRLPRFAASLPVMLQPLVKTPRDILLTLALYGDKSDNIPKIIGRSKELIPILRSEYPFQRAHTLYGNLFLHNLWMVTLPFPSLVEPIPDREDMPKIMDRLFPNWIGSEFKIKADLVKEIDHYLMTGEYDAQ